MNTINAHPGINYEQHQLEMLLWHAEVYERNGKKREASKIRDWIADFVAQRGGTELGLVQREFVKP
jgi:hypothetical protein